jgi:hypothetical protein
MIDEKYINLLTAYLDNSITPKERIELDKLIDRGEIDILDLKEMENTYNRLGTIPIAEPSVQMRHSFYTMLETEKQRQASKYQFNILNLIKDFITPKRVQWASLTTGIFLIGMLVGNLFTPFRDYHQQMNELSSEVSHMREVVMMSLLDAQSPSERLKAVNISTDIASADDRVITALLKTLNEDPNVNVRLASIEALLRHADNPTARKGLVESISRQESPQIQVALADAMLALQETRSVDELQRILEQNGLDSSVRDKLKNTIAALS